MARISVFALLLSIVIALADPVEDSLALLAVAISRKSLSDYDEQQETGISKELENAFIQAEREFFEQVRYIKDAAGNVEPKDEPEEEQEGGAQKEAKDEPEEAQEESTQEETQEGGVQEVEEMRPPGEEMRPSGEEMRPSGEELEAPLPQDAKTWEWCPNDGLSATLQSAASVVTSVSSLINMNADKVCIPFEGKTPCLRKVFRIAEELLKVASTHAKAYGTCVMPGAISAMPFQVAGGILNPSSSEDPIKEAKSAYCRTAAIDSSSSFVIGISDLLSLMENCFTANTLDKALAFVNEDCVMSKALAGFSMSDDFLQASNLATNMAGTQCRGVDSLNRQRSVLCRISTLSSMEARFLSAARLVQAIDTCATKANHTRAAVCAGSLLKIGSTYYRLSKSVEYTHKSGCKGYVAMMTGFAAKMARMFRRTKRVNAPVVLPSGLEDP